MGEGSPSGGENEEVEEQGEGREGGGVHITGVQKRNEERKSGF